MSKMIHIDVLRLHAGEIASKANALRGPNDPEVTAADAAQKLVDAHVALGYTIQIGKHAASDDLNFASSDSFTKTQVLPQGFGNAA